MPNYQVGQTATDAGGNKVRFDGSAWVPVAPENPLALPSPEAEDVSGLAARYPFAAGMAQGIGEMVSNVGDLFGVESDPTVDPDYAKASYQAFAEENPSAEIGRKTARAAPALASAALPGGLAAQMAYSVPLAALEDDFEKAAATGAAATGIFGTLGKAATGIRGGLAGRTRNLPEQAAEFAERGGYVPTGSAVEQMASKHPWTARPFREAAERNTEILTQDALAALGNVTDNLTDEGLEQAGRVLGDQFQQIGENIPPIRVPRAVTEFLEVLDPRTKTLAEIGEDLTQNRLTGRQAMLLRSRLTKLGQSSDNLVADAAHRVRRTLDDTISEVAPEGVQDAWGALREQWRNYEYGIKKIRSATGRDPLTGNLQAPVTVNRMRNVYAKGGGPTQPETRQLMDTAGVMASDLFKDFSPNPSGTAAATTVLDFTAQASRALGAIPALAALSKGGNVSGALGRAAALEMLPEEEDENIPVLLRRAP